LLTEDSLTVGRLYDLTQQLLHVLWGQYLTAGLGQHQLTARLLDQLTAGLLDEDLLKQSGENRQLIVS